MIIKRQFKRDVDEYLHTVMKRFRDNREIYYTVTKLLEDLRYVRDTSKYSDIISKVTNLLKGHTDLILGFNKFLPNRHKIRLQKDQTQRRKPEFGDAVHFLNKVKARLQDERAFKSFLEILRMFNERKKSFTEVYDEVFHVLRCHQDLRAHFTAFLPARYRYIIL